MRRRVFATMLLLGAGAVLPWQGLHSETIKPVRFSTKVAAVYGPHAGLFTKGDPALIRYDLDPAVADSDQASGAGTYRKATLRIVVNFPASGVDVDFSQGTTQVFDNTSNPDDQISIRASANQGSSNLAGEAITQVELGFTGLTTMLADDGLPDFVPHDIKNLSVTFGTSSGFTRVALSAEDVAAAPVFVPGSGLPHDAAGDALAEHSGCFECHHPDEPVTGPPYRDVAARYRDDPDIRSALIETITHGGKGNWTEVTGGVPMPPHSNLLSQAEIERLVDWVLGH